MMSAAAANQTNGDLITSRANECPICFEIYSQQRMARILRCGHTFCEECISNPKLMIVQGNDLCEVCLGYCVVINAMQHDYLLLLTD